MHEVTLGVGDRVKHPTLGEQWGPGEVLGVSHDGKVTVQFALVGQKTLKGVKLEKLEGTDAGHPLLDQRKAPTKGKRKTRAFSTMRDLFLRLFPGGFSDPDYLAQERTEKVEAGEKLRGILGRGEYEVLLRDKAFSEISKRALLILNATSLVLPNEKKALKDGLGTRPARQLFGKQLGALLYGSEEYRVRFEAFIDTLEQIGANHWTLATYFPFLAFPEEQMLLKADVTRRVAEACNVELNYRVDLNWWTYDSLLRFTSTLHGQLSELKPRDNIDIQSFLFCIGERV